MASPTERMSRAELRATLALAMVFSLRMFGMFSILPVLALYAKGMPGGDSPFLIGVALGIDGLAQAILQIPFGLLSDRYGRKRVIYMGFALLAVGSLIAASADTVQAIIFGRLIQGTGAVSAAVMALTADLTREEHRSKSMALIGMSIGVTFAVSLVLGPTLNHGIGVPGIFMLTSVLAFFAMAVVRFVVPDPLVSRPHADAQTVPGQIRAVLRNAELQRLNFGIFSLHATMRGLFLVIPLALVEVGGLPGASHWQVYLPILVLSFLAMMPGMFLAERKGRLKLVFCTGVALLCLASLLMALFIHHYTGILVTLFLFFLAFNLLEAMLPSLVSRIAPAGSKGTAMGVYNSFQFFGLFLGGALGGLLVQRIGNAALFVFASGLSLAWLMFALSMAPPKPVRTHLIHVGRMDKAQARKLSHALAKLAGVSEAVVIASDGVAYLKVRMSEWDEAGAHQLINKGV